jgi:hypothetical protein
MNSNEQARTGDTQAPAAPSRQPVCCSSPASICYWCTVSFVVWGLLGLVGMYWHPLHATSPATILLAVSIGCFINWFKNRTFHCGITAWIFLAGAIVFLLTDLGVIQIDRRVVWPFIGVGTLFAFLLEWRFAHRVANQQLMKITEQGAPAAAIVAALSTLSCCLPFGFLGAVGLAGVSFWARQYSRWFLIASIVFLLIGAAQLYFKESCVKRSKTCLVLFWTAVVVVLLVLLFPQVLASLIAG